MAKHQLTAFDGDDQGRTSCYQAARWGNEIILRYLFRNYGSKLFTYASSKGLIPLHVAVASWRQETVHTLITCGSPMNARTTAIWYDPGMDYPSIPAGATPLDIAIRMHSVALVILLKLNGGETSLPDELTEGQKEILKEANDDIAAQEEEAGKMIPYVKAVCYMPAPVLGIIARYAVEYPKHFFFDSVSLCT